MNLGEGEMFNKSPWFSIWIHPKETIESIVSVNPNHRLWPLATVYGFSSLMNLAQVYAPGYQFNLLTILIASIVLAPFWGYFLYGVSSFLIAKTGRWLNGSASFIQVRAVAIWASVPFIINVLCWVVMIIVFGEGLFKDFPGGNILSSLQMNIVLTVMLIKLGMTIWALVIYLQGLTVVHKFSIAKSMLNVVIVAFIIFVILLILWIAIVNTCGHFFDVPLITWNF